jgi:uncharacterized protein YndB with AHSA1/START domain
MKGNVKLTVKVEVNAYIDNTWQLFIDEDCIIHWNYASEDWCCPWARNNFKVNGEFVYRMEAKNGSFGFDFGGKYLAIEAKRRILYELGDKRRVEVHFIALGEKTRIIETFDAEKENPSEMQKNGWQAILNNFKKYVEQDKV